MAIFNNDQVDKTHKKEQGESPEPENPAETEQRAATYATARAERQRRELWMYLAVSIVAVEVMVFAAALLFGFMRGAVQGASGTLVFPWLSWTAAALALPAIILICVHMAVGLFSSGQEEQDAEWQKHLPEKLRKAYSIIARAPAVVLLFGLLLLGTALFTIEGALQAMESLLALLIPYVPHILAGIGVLLALIGVSAFFFAYRTRKVYAEYEYRRAVLEKTGMIIVDKRSLVLQPGEGMQGYFTPIAAPEAAKALPPSPTAENGETIEVIGELVEESEKKAEDAV